MTSVVSDAYIWERCPRAIDTVNSYRTKLASDASTYQLGEIVRIAVPPVHHGFLNTANSWLNVTVKSTDGQPLAASTTQTTPKLSPANLCFSHIGINSCFDQVNVIGPNGQYVSNVQNYQPIYAVNWANNTNRDNAMANSITDRSAPIEDLSIVNPDVTFHTVRGQSLADEATQVDGSTTQVTLGEVNCSPVLNGLLNTTKSLPVCWFSSDCYVELYITNDVRNMFFTAGQDETLVSGGLTFSFELDCQFDVVTDNSMRMIKDHAGYGLGPVSWSDTQQRCSTYTIRADELAQTALNTKSQVINGVKPRKLLSVQQAAFSSNQNGDRDPWEHVNPYFTFQLRIGTELYPPRAQEGLAQMYAGVGECYNQYAYTTQANRIKFHEQNDIGPVFPRLHSSSGGSGSAGTTYNHVRVGSAGVNLANFPGLSNGLDVSDVQIESLGLLGKDTQSIWYNMGTTAELENANYTVYSLKRYGVLYSVSDQGDFTVSY